MPYFDLFFWDEQNEEHITQHGVTTAEYEYVVRNAKKAGASHSSGRPIVFGVTEAGRKLGCVYEMIDDLYSYPDTAYEVE